MSAGAYFNSCVLKPVMATPAGLHITSEILHHTTMTMSKMCMPSCALSVKELLSWCVKVVTYSFANRLHSVIKGNM